MAETWRFAKPWLQHCKLKVNKNFTLTERQFQNHFRIMIFTYPPNTAPLINQHCCFAGQFMNGFCIWMTTASWKGNCCASIRNWICYAASQ